MIQTCSLCKISRLLVAFIKHGPMNTCPWLNMLSFSLYFSFFSYHFFMILHLFQVIYWNGCYPVLHGPVPIFILDIVIKSYFPVKVRAPFVTSETFWTRRKIKQGNVTLNSQVKTIWHRLTIECCSIRSWWQRTLRFTFLVTRMGYITICFFWALRIFPSSVNLGRILVHPSQLNGKFFVGSF